MGPVVGGGIATLLSLLVVSRVIADNPLYRLAQYLLVGVALGYVAAVLFNQTLLPAIVPLADGQVPPLDQVIVLATSAILLVLFATRFGRQQWSYMANVPLAVLFGVGAAVAGYGALRGTLVPQLLDSVALRRLQTPDITAVVGTAVLLVTMILTLLLFTYTQRGEQPSAATRTMRRVGRGLVLATFGVFLATAVTTYVTALVTQIQFIADWINSLL